jgi:hypothetical protein
METIGENIQYSSQSDLILYGNIIMGGQVYWLNNHNQNLHMVNSNTYIFF